MSMAFITVVYIAFGAIVSPLSRRKSYAILANYIFLLKVYSKLGQYSASTITQAIQPFSLQTVSNVFALLTGAVACRK